jgi:hypothetical protein
MEKVVSEDSVDRKKFMFYDTAKRQADLKIRLKYDGLNQSQFFRMVITGYLERDEEFMKYFAKQREESKIHSSEKRSKSKKLAEKGQETKKHFLLDDSDIENIFDIMERGEE